MSTFKLIKSESFQSFTKAQGCYPKLALNLVQRSTKQTFDSLAYCKADDTIFVSFAKDVKKDGTPKDNWKPIEHTMEFVTANWQKLIVVTQQKYEDEACTQPTMVEKKNADGTITKVPVFAYTLTWEGANAWQTIVLPFAL